MGRRRAGAAEAIILCGITCPLHRATPVLAPASDPLARLSAGTRRLKARACYVSEMKLRVRRHECTRVVTSR